MKPFLFKSEFFLELCCLPSGSNTVPGLGPGHTLVPSQEQEYQNSLQQSFRGILGSTHGFSKLLMAAPAVMVGNANYDLVIGARFLSGHDGAGRYPGKSFSVD
ncbi:hypothetical protein DSO57_1007551 [Entomophthora muscae]|uniref:Uncharacterized protein n=1 Tax=Entomophthora muscae TaxID=34485 RepID=A0ACC2RM52_9FUNG|nr:hypothetical protein DSO57_1007551 [Entomophthora muscae]